MTNTAYLDQYHQHETDKFTNALKKLMPNIVRYCIDRGEIEPSPIWVYAWADGRLEPICGRFFAYDEIVHAKQVHAQALDRFQTRAKLERIPAIDYVVEFNYSDNANRWAGNCTGLSYIVKGELICQLRQFTTDEIEAITGQRL